MSDLAKHIVEHAILKVQSFMGFTQGAVLFMGPGGNVKENSAELFWDDTNDRLGIGTNAPAEALDVSGNVNLAWNVTKFIYGDGSVAQVNFEADNSGGTHSVSFTNDGYSAKFGWTQTATTAIFTGTDCDMLFETSANNDFIQFSTKGTSDLMIFDSSFHLIRGGTVRLGSASNHTEITSEGDLSFVGTAGFYPVRLTQSAQPTPDTGELLIWRDPDDNKTYLVYNDTDEGVRTSELI